MQSYEIQAVVTNKARRLVREFLICLLICPLLVEVLAYDSNWKADIAVGCVIAIPVFVVYKILRFAIGF